MKILVIEDDKKISDYIVKGFKEHGCNIDACADGKDGLFLATTEQYDVMIVDRMLPSLDGIKIVKSIRAAGIETPVIILSALSDVEEKVEGLKSGCDDYLAKPFAFAELHARVDVIAKRAKNSNYNVETVLHTHDIEICLLSRKVTKSGQPVDVQGKEFNLLEFLVRNKGKVITRTMLLESVWEYHFDPQTNIIDVHISRLRKKISDENGSIIKTVRGAGYIIEEEK